MAVINGYEKQLNLNRFDLLIDWGLVYFITKLLFIVIDHFYHLVGQFGLAILIVTVLIKAAFLPARQQVRCLDGEDEGASRRWRRCASAIPTTRPKQQQELMALYKKEKINLVAGCCRW